MRIPFIEEQRLILSLYDYTGKWAEPYINAGYPVMLWDKKTEGDILEGLSWLIMQIEETGYNVYGILAAPPCTDFAVSGARWFKEKDKATKGYEPFDSTTELSIALVEIVMHLVDILKPIFWVIENPVGRIETLVPSIKKHRKFSFDPCDFGDAYTKKTILWGEFNTNLKRNPVEPVMYECGGKKSSWIWAKLGGKSEKTKALRSVTPTGFANAFFEANS
jgi:hypothetical protein